MKQFLILVLFSSNLLASHLGKNVIYGEDGRKEVHEAKLIFREFAKSTPVMVPNDAIEATAVSHYFNLRQRSLNQSLLMSLNEKIVFTPNSAEEDLGNQLSSQIGFCSNERFVHQPSAGQCSGFLIAPDLIVTAGHCALQEGACEKFKWVFDYKIDPETGSAGLNVPAQDIYSCKKIISASLDMTVGADYAVLQLDRKVEGRNPLKLREEGKISDRAELTVIGNPSGLPLKVTEGGFVRSNTSPFYFEANLDTYQGNSGSVVLNTQTLEVEGILVRGDNDFVLNQNLGCIESNRCSDDGCRGEGVSRIHSIPEVSLYRLLMRASELGRVDILSQILQYIDYVDFNLADGETALMKAARSNQLEAVKFLVTHGADVNASDINGDTATHHLARVLNGKNSEVLDYLLSMGANLTSINKLFQTPSMVAQEMGNSQAEMILILR